MCYSSASTLVLSSKRRAGVHVYKLSTAPAIVSRLANLARRVGAVGLTIVEHDPAVAVTPLVAANALIVAVDRSNSRFPRRRLGRRAEHIARIVRLPVGRFGCPWAHHLSLSAEPCPRRLRRQDRVLRLQCLVN